MLKCSLRQQWLSNCVAFTVLSPVLRLKLCTNRSTHNGVSKACLWREKGYKNMQEASVLVFSRLWFYVLAGYFCLNCGIRRRSDVHSAASSVTSSAVHVCLQIDNHYKRMDVQATEAETVCSTKSPVILGVLTARIWVCLLQQKFDLFVEWILWAAFTNNKSSWPTVKYQECKQFLFDNYN